MVLLLAIMSCDCMYAQLSVKTDVTGTTACPAVTVSDEHHAVVGSEVTFNITFNPNLKENERNATIKSAELIFCGETRKLALSNSAETTVAEHFKMAENVLKAGASVSVKYSFEVFNGTEWIAHSDSTITVSSDIVNIYPVPVCGYTQDRAYSTKSRTITHSGGYSDGWKYSLNSGAEQTGSSVAINIPTTLPTLVTSNVVMRNYAPDGKTLWYDENEQYETYFYKAGSIKISSATEKKTKFYKNTGESTWKIDLADANPDGWVIKWEGGEEVGTSSSYKPFTKNIAQTLLNGKISVEVTNLKDTVVLYHEKLDVATISVYKEISQERENTVSINMYKGESVVLTADEEDGGNPDGWKYEWKYLTFTGKSLTVSPTSSTYYTLTAGNYLDGQLLYEYTKQYIITCFASPQVNESVTSVMDGKTASSMTQNTLKNKEVEAPVYNMIVGDEAKISVEASGGQDASWESTVTLDNKVIATGKNKVTYTFNATKAGEYTVKVNSKNGDKKFNAPYASSITRKIVVYDKPETKDTIFCNYYAGQIAKYGITNKLSGDWYWKWNDGTQGDSIIVSTQNVTAMKSDTLECVASLSCSGVVREGYKQIVVLNTWPKPEVEIFTIKLRDKASNAVKNITYYSKQNSASKNIEINCFDKDTIDIAYKVVGGYRRADYDSWTYVHNYLSRGILENGTGTDYMIMKNAASGSKTTTYELTLRNKLPQDVPTVNNNNTWLEEKYNVTINTWPTPSVTESHNDSIARVSRYQSYQSKYWDSDRVDVYAGGYEQNKVNFVVNHQGGCTLSDAWEYEWIDDGVTVSTNDTHWTYVPQTSLRSQDKEIEVKVSNHIGDNYALTYTKTYLMRVWKKAEFSMPTIVDEKQNRDMLNGVCAVRAGNRILGNIASITGGYNNSSSYYNYEWKYPSNERIFINVGTMEWYTSTSTQEKGAKNYSISVRSSNTGPYGRIWDASPLITRNVMVYNRPETPASLVKKGTGASGTMICTTSISDEDLDSKQYYLVFGYRDANGVDHDMVAKRQYAPGNVRWSERFDSRIMSNSANKFYVYAQWIYDDNVIITSDRRYSDGVLQEWDGSDYSKSTRANDPDDSNNITGIEEVNADSMPADKEDGIGGQKENLPRIYTIDGTPVNSGTKLSRGIYIYENMVNGKRTIKKIYVK